MGDVRDPQLAQIVHPQEIEIGKQIVRALIDSGAEATCCSKGWYERNKLALGGLNLRLNAGGLLCEIGTNWDSVPNSRKWDFFLYLAF